MSAVADKKNIAVKHLAVTGIPRSGPPTVLIDMFGISSRHVIDAVSQLMTV